MKPKKILFFAVATIVATSALAYTHIKQARVLSPLVKANIDALSDGENPHKEIIGNKVLIYGMRNHQDGTTPGCVELPGVCVINLN